MQVTLRNSLAAILFSLISTGAIAQTEDLSTSSLSSEAQADTVTYIDFWASWCKPCLKSFPWMNEMQARYAEHGLKVIAVNVDAQTKDAEEFLARHPPGFSVKFDNKGQIASEFSVKAMPSSFLYGRDGKLISSHLGFRQKDRAKYESSIRAALGLEE